MPNKAVNLEFPTIPAPESQELARVPDFSHKVGIYFFSSLLLLLPLFFGGTNITGNYLAYFFTFCCMAAVLYTCEIQVDSSIKFLRALIFYVVLQSIFISIPSSELLYSTLLSLLFFSAVFVIAKVYLKSDVEALGVLTGLISIAGFLVSLIALSHWFYDNGKLFWVYEPMSLRVSDRARWPFVNPNHLGNFLLLSVFVQISLIGSSIGRLLKARFDYVGRKGSFVTNFLSSARIQGKLIKLALSSVMLLASTVALTATLSRGSWTGFGMGISIYLLSTMFLSYRKKSAALEVVPDENELEKRRIRRMIMGYKVEFSRMMRKAAKPFAVIVGALIFLFFLNDQGQELVKDRVEYGLKYSLDDMRWTMYEDTLHMMKDYPLFGIGFGQWQRVYPRYMDESLSGINPVYLHSEPLQGLAELGLIGSGIVLLFAIYIVSGAIKVIKKTTSHENRLLVGLLSGLLGFFIASLVEFPLRMPAIQVILAVNLALIIFETERLKLSST